MNDKEATTVARLHIGGILQALSQLGYSVSKSKESGWIFHHTYEVAGKPVVDFSLRPYGYSSRRYGPFEMQVEGPAVEFDTHGYIHRPVQWREPKRGWSEESARAHATKIAAFIEARRKEITAGAERQAERELRVAAAERVNAALGLSEASPVRAETASKQGNVGVRLDASYSLPEAEAQQILWELASVLRRLKLMKE